MLLARQRYHCGELEEAYAFAREAEALIPFSAGFVTRAEHAFYYSLIAAALYDSAAPEQQGELLAIIEQNLARLEGWAEGAPTNYRPLYLLLAAERARIRGDVLEAMQDYDVAIAEATNQGFAQIEALGAELAARFWQTRKKPDFVSIYLGKALEAYEIWGAAGKVEDLRAAYGLRPRHDKSHPLTAGSTTMGGTTEHGDALDLGTALKASQAIAGEIVLDRLVAKMMGIILENAGADHAALVIESDGEFLVQGTKSARGGEAEVMLGQPLNRSRRLSRGIVNYVIRTNEHVALTDPALRGRFSKDPYVCEHRPKSVLCAPILYKGKLTGVVYLENNQVAGAFTPNRLEALNVLMSQIAISIDNATLYSRLEQQAHSIEQANTALATEVGERKAAEKELSRYRDHLEELVAQRTRELENAQGRLVELSRRAGMAEVAAGVLHNVGNVMNSVNVGAHVARDAIRELRVESLAKVADELQQQSGRLGEYLSTDPAGSRIPEYLAKLAKALGADKERIRIELERLLEHLEHMKRVIAAQQSYAKTNGVTEVCTVTEILDTALSISEVALRNASVQVVTQTDTDEPALLDRHQVLQILINLISNAKHAVQENDPADRRIRISIARNDGFFCVEVTDNGAGITPENLPQVFNHGFTTKKTGHGFGLHNCANAAQEMGGSLEAFSAGPGRGARFLLRLPVRPADSAALRSGAA
jgi:signal transduction histidine kinase